MAEYKFDGKLPRNKSGSRVAEIDGRYVRDSRDSRVADFDGEVRVGSVLAG